MFRRFRSAILMWFRRDEFESQLGDDVRGHLEDAVEDLISRGIPRAEAERRARLQFGTVESVKEECREQVLFSPLLTFFADFRRGFRLLRRNPAFAAVAIATLALCIGANSAVFSMVDSVMFRPLPYPDSDRLAQVVVKMEHEGRRDLQSAADGREWGLVRDNLDGIDLAIFSDWTTGVNLVADDRLAYVQQQKVSTGFFRVLGVQPRTGRGFLPREDVEGGPAVTVISDDLWERLFDRNEEVLGSHILLKGEEYEIVGVMPPGFESTSIADLWTPLRAPTDGDGRNFVIVGRLPEDMSWSSAETRIARLSDAYLEGQRLPEGLSARLGFLPLGDVSNRWLHLPLVILWCAVGVVLLIGCVNLAGLLLARSSSRSREIAIRKAIGGGRAPIVRQLVAEGLALAICGGVAGLVLGAAGIRVLERAAVETLGLSHSLHLDARVVAFTLATSVFSTLVFGLYPAWRMSRTEIATVLAESGARISAGRTRHLSRRILVVAEVSLGVLLLVAAVMLVRSFSHLRGIEPGFDPDALISATVSLEDARYQTTEPVTRLFERTLEKVRSTPGIESAAASLTLPYERALNLGFSFPETPDDTRVTNVVYLTPGYFETLRAPVLEGRDLLPSDRPGTPRVAVVNRSFVGYALGDRRAIGTRIAFSGETWEIVGVVGDIVQRSSFGNYGPVSPIPAVYVPVAQFPDDAIPMVHGWFSPSWIVRSESPARAVQVVRDALREADPLLPLAEARTIDDLAREALTFQRFQAMLMGSMALLALLLSGVGLGGFIASLVSEQRREIGIRLALGAPRGRTVVSVSMTGVTLTAAGLGIGALLTPLAMRALNGLVWGIAPTDPATIARVIGILLAVSIVASVVPALRIARLDPVRTLRES